MLDVVQFYNTYENVSKKKHDIKIVCLHKNAMKIEKNLDFWHNYDIKDINATSKILKYKFSVGQNFLAL